MDSQTLGIGVFIGVALGALVVGLLLRSRLRAAELEATDTARELDEAQQKVAELRAESTALIESAARTLSQTTGQAQGVVSLHVRSHADLSAELAQLLAKIEGGEGADAAADAAAINAAQQATELLAGREEQLAQALEQLRRRTEVVDGIIDGTIAEERMTEHKLDDLVTASAEALEVAATMDEVIRKLQEGAAETSELSTQVSTEAERGYRAVHRTLDEIERIRGLSGVARSRIESLGDRVAGIGHVVKVIQEITEKTNLLALNASIIAAQAGEHGRSFSVVAHEIKALAQRTSASTKEISEQIREVQTESERATAAMVDGVAAVNEGFQVAISAGDALDAIRQSAKGAQRKMQQMTRSLRQQNKVAQRVVDSAAAVSDRANSFAAAVRGQSTTSDRLRAAAVDLQALGREIADTLTEQGSSTALCVDTIARVSERMALLRRRERELRAALRDVEDGTAGGKRFGDEMAARWAAISEATSRLSDSVSQLQGRT